MTERLFIAPIGQLLLRIEADAHRRGWDEAPALYVLYDDRDRDTALAYHQLAGRYGPAVRERPYAARSILPPGTLDGIASHVLYRFALNLMHADGHPAVAAILGMLSQPGFIGAAFLFEGWMRTAKSVEERDALGDVRFADIPGSVEFRSVMAVDIEGNEFSANRQRGEKPRLERAGGGDMERTEGAIVESLRVIVAKVAGRPAPEFVNVPSRWDWDAERERQMP